VDKSRNDRALAVAYSAENRKQVKATPLSRTNMFKAVNDDSVLMNIEMNKQVDEDLSS
jgi:hypothetical protein